MAPTRAEMATEATAPTRKAPSCCRRSQQARLRPLTRRRAAPRRQVARERRRVASPCPPRASPHRHPLSPHRHLLSLCRLSPRPRQVTPPRCRLLPLITLLLPRPRPATTTAPPAAP